jgi:Carboxypeptidase regulatory-like domain
MKPMVGPAILLTALLASRAAWAQEHALTGTVTDSAGKPLVAVAVSAPAVGPAAETDSTGRFSLGPLHPDTVLIRFEKVGYRVGRARVLIRETDEARVPLGTVQLKAALSRTVTLRLVAHEQLSGRPVEGAALELNGRPAVYTSAEGSVTQQGVRIFAGLNAAVVRRIGYQAVAFDLWIPESEHEVALEVQLKPTAITLPDVVVVGNDVQVRYPWTDAFLQRVRMGMGDFLTANRIKRIHSIDAMGLLRWLPGHSVWIQGSPASGYRFHILGETPGSDCHGPLFYVNGVFTSTSSAVDQLEMTLPEDVLGVEVYRHAGEVPPEYNMTGSLCGVIAFWIRP